MTRQTLRKLLIATAFACILLCIFQLGSQLYYLSDRGVFAVKMGQNVQHVVMTTIGILLSSIQSLAFALFCLFAADQIKPFKTSSDNGETND